MSVTGDRGAGVAQELSAKGRGWCAKPRRSPSRCRFPPREAQPGPHEAKTDHDALRFKKTKGVGAKLAYLGPLLMENLHGLVVST